jgi:hypothetical protein
MPRKIARLKYQDPDIGLLLLDPARLRPVDIVSFDDQVKNPIPTSSIPPVERNPFLKRRSRPIDSEIGTASEFGFFRNGLVDKIDNTIAQHALALLAFVDHDLSVQKTQDDAVFPHLPPEDQHMAHLFNKDVRKLLASIKSKTTGVYLKGVTTLVIRTGGRITWRRATHKQRLAVYGAVWDQDPYSMAMKTNPLVNQYVDFDAIYQSYTPEAMKWRRFARMAFMLLCDKKYNICAGARRSARFALRWEEIFKGRSSIQALGIGGPEEVPSKRPSIMKLRQHRRTTGGE